jgi:glutamate dehydrogenase
MFAYEDLMGLLEDRGLLDRASEDLPTAEEIAERRRSGRGMERPELATLVAYAKRWIARELEGSAYVEEPALRHDLEDYFPDAVVRRCAAHLDAHPLRAELLRMISSNSVVNSLGPTFVSQLVTERGTDVATVMRAYRIARDVIRADALWDPIERLRDADRAAQAELMTGVDDLVEAVTRWYVAWPLDGTLEEIVEHGREAFDRYAAALPRFGGEERARRREEAVRRLVAAGVPEAMAQAHALRADLVHGPDVTRTAARTGRSVEDVAEAFFSLGAALRLDWMETELARVRSATRVQRWALQAVREDAAEARRDVTEQALRAAGDAPAEEAVEEAVERFLEARAEPARRLADLLRALSREGDPDLAGFTLAVRQLRALAR